MNPRWPLGTQQTNLFPLGRNFFLFGFIARLRTGTLGSEILASLGVHGLILVGAWLASPQQSQSRSLPTSFEEGSTVVSVLEKPSLATHGLRHRHTSENEKTASALPLSRENPPSTNSIETIAPGSRAFSDSQNASLERLSGRIRDLITPYKTYPALAEEQGIEGTVVLEFRLKQGTSTGLIDSLTVVTSSGTPILDRAAVYLLEQLKLRSELAEQLGSILKQEGFMSVKVILPVVYALK